MGSPTPSSVQMTRMSRTMAWVLRHGAPHIGLQMTSDGFVPVEDLLYWCISSRHCRKIPKECWTVEMIERIVALDPKRRYSISKDVDGKLLICAVQGHSIENLDDEGMLTRITEENVNNYPIALHGTTKEKWLAIQLSGELKSGYRRHIHFAQSLSSESGVTLGVRSTSNVFIYIDLRKAIGEGFRFYVSKNGVILCSGLPGHKSKFRLSPIVAPLNQCSVIILLVVNLPLGLLPNASNFYPFCSC